MSVSPKEVWITGIGLVSSLGEGLDAHWQALRADKPKPIVDETSFAPYTIHPICELDYSKQIPKRGDLRQMEDWQRIGTYAAGLALDDAGIKGDEDLLAKTHIIAAAGNGERDPDADATVLEAIKGDPDWRDKLNDLLLTNLRPTLYLAQQTQLLAGNISIVHKVTGGSRTYKGEEIAGVQIVENAVQRIQAGQGELFLVGAAYNAARWDQLLIDELNGKGRGSDEENYQTGSMGAFLVLEEKEHALERGVSAYAKITEIKTGQGIGAPYTGVSCADLMLPIEGDHIGDVCPVQRSTQSILGHGIEAQFPAAMALSALALSKNELFSPFGGSADQKFTEDLSGILVNCWGIRHGEGTALVERIEDDI